MSDENNIIFHEEQKFSPALSALIVVLMVLTVGLTGFALRELIHELKPASPLAIIILIITGFIFPTAIGVLFLTLKLETRLRRDGLYLRFFPIHIRYKKFALDDISEFYPRRYRPILEYGGWGIRWSFKKGKAYNVTGNRGLQLVFKNGRRLLIGSQKADQFAQAIQSLLEQNESRQQKEQNEPTADGL